MKAGGASDSQNIRRIFNIFFEELEKRISKYN